VTERIYVKQASELLDRRPATLRWWDREHILPRYLRSRRDGNGWRWWTPEQIEKIREWMRETDRRPGKGLPHYKPTDKELHEHLEGIRRPRRKSR
jgi:DNA-binding transcriptional MerR regulator